MRDGWDHVPLEELLVQVKEPVKVERGLAYKLLGVRWYGNGPFIRETVTSETSKATRLFPVQSGDFIYNRLFAWKGSFGLISHELEGCFVSSEFPLFRVRHDRLNAVLLNLIMCQPSKWAQIEIESTGSTSVSRNRWKEDRFLEQVLFLPSLVEQNRIVDLVSSVDAYIDALQLQADMARTARNATLHELLSAAGDDWTETTLGEVASFEYGKPLKAENRDGIGFPVFGSAGEVGRHSEPMINDAPVIVVGRKGTAGAVWWSDLPCSVIDTAYYVVPKVSVNFDFLFLLLGFLDLPSLTAQTGVPGLNRDRAYSSEVNLPPMVEQNRIAEIVLSMDDVIRSTEHAITDAKNLRSGLLSDLLSGEHEIPMSYDRLLKVA